ncbi:hypothetical protein M0R04_07385 [Candidatus Dojkabacteria bacterium]|jgi:hypothetical protein|nr:hypothetical protein [Candidatus Dojkabacteria bacterium]
MSYKTWEIMKWLSNVCAIVGTILLLSPIMASKSITPWLILMLGNTLIVGSFIREKNYPLITLSMFFFGWDILVIISRLTSHNVFGMIDPILNILEKILP